MRLFFCQRMKKETVSMSEKNHLQTLKSGTGGIPSESPRRPEFTPESLRKIPGNSKTGLLTPFTPDKIQPATQNN